MSEFLKIGRRTFLKGSAAASALMALAACKKDDGATAEAGTEGATAKVYINNPVSIDPYNCQESVPNIPGARPDSHFIVPHTINYNCVR